MIAFIRSVLSGVIFGLCSVLFYPILGWWGIAAGVAGALVTWITISEFIRHAFPFPLIARTYLDCPEIMLWNTRSEPAHCTIYFVDDPNSDSHVLILSHSCYTFDMDLDIEKVIIRVEGAIGEICIERADTGTLFTHRSLTYSSLNR